MAIARVQNPAPASGADVLSIGLAWTQATAAGNLLVAVVSARGVTSAPVITPPAGWTSVLANYPGTPSPKIEIFAIENAGSRSGTETFTLDVARDCSLALLEYSGIATAAALDKTATAGSTVGTVTIDTGTTAVTAQADELELAAFGSRNSTTTHGAIKAGWTQIATGTTPNATTANAIAFSHGERIVAATEAANSTTALGTARPWTGQVATYKAAAGGGLPAVSLRPAAPASATPPPGGPEGRSNLVSILAPLAVSLAVSPPGIEGRSDLVSILAPLAVSLAVSPPGIEGRSELVVLLAPLVPPAPPGPPPVIPSASLAELSLSATWPDNSRVLDLTERQTGLRWSSAAVGGFGSCSFSLPGLVGPSELPYLAMLRVQLGTLVLWEGRLEDRRYSVSFDEQRTDIQAFGLQRLLVETSVVKAWMNLPSAYSWNIPASAVGTDGETPAHTLVRNETGWQPSMGPDAETGSFEFRHAVAGTGQTVAVGDWAGFRLLAAPGVSFTTFHGRWSTAQTNVRGIIQESTDQVSYLRHVILPTDPVEQLITLAAGTNEIRVGGYMTVATAFPAGGFVWTATSITVMGTSLPRTATFIGSAGDEQVFGYYLPGTLLNDLIKSVPGLVSGTIDAGSGLTTDDPRIHRAWYDRRGPAAEIVADIAQYYTRDWAVWEDGRFDWRSQDFLVPQWITTVADCVSIELESSTETLVKMQFVTYESATRSKEASSTATSQANPYLRSPYSKDRVTAAGALSDPQASALALRLAGLLGSYVPLHGSVTLPATLILSGAGGSIPAYAIRGGQNLRIVDLPYSDPFAIGQEGETIFHVVASETDLEQGTVSLELESQGRAVDVVLARLAAATR